MIESFEMPKPMLLVKAGDAYLTRLGMQGGTPKAFGRLAVSVLSRRGAVPARSFGEPVYLEGLRNATGHLVFFNRARGIDGVTREPYFAPGRYDLRITSEYYRPILVPNVAMGAADLKEFDPVEVTLEPGYNYPFPSGRLPNGHREPTLLRGSVEVKAGGGGADADGFQVTVSGAGDAMPYTTEADGQWLMLFSDKQKDATLSVTVSKPGTALKRVIPGIAVKAGKAVSVPPVVFKTGGGG